MCSSKVESSRSDELRDPTVFKLTGAARGVTQMKMFLKFLRTTVLLSR